MIQKSLFEYVGSVLAVTVLLLGTFMFGAAVFGAGATTTVSTAVEVGNATPSVSSVSLNGASDVILTPNTTTNVNVNATISDNNGCGDITNGTTTITLYRSGVTSSSCQSSQDALNCYKATAFTASSTCSSGTQNTTTTFAVQYFAEATDSSSSFSAQNWRATVTFRDPSNGTSSADSAGGTTPDVTTLTAINVTTSSINYGTLSASSTTAGTNQTSTVANSGNSSTTLKLRASVTLSGPGTITTSSQRYSTSTFTFPGTSTALTDSDVSVNGFSLTSPTSTTNVIKTVFWGLEVPAGTATGTYSGTTVFTSAFQN